MDSARYRPLTTSLPYAKQSLGLCLASNYLEDLPQRGREIAGQGSADVGHDVRLLGGTDGNSTIGAGQDFVRFVNALRIEDPVHSQERSDISEAVLVQDPEC